MLRALQPSEDRVSLVKVGHPVAGLQRLLGVMGQCLAWAQLRSSGRDGSATADDLIAFGRQSRWQPRMVDLAHEVAAEVQTDWTRFAEAFDDGVFDQRVTNSRQHDNHGF